MKQHQWLNEQTVSIALAIIVVIGTLFARMVWRGTPTHPQRQTSIYAPLNAHRMRNQRKVLNKRRPLSFLVAVTANNGQLSKHPGRVQTLILITANRQKQRITVTSLPANHVVSLPDYGHHSSAALGDIASFGGSRELVNAVQQDLNVPVDYYLMLTPTAVNKVIKQVNGVAVTPPATFTSHHIHFIRNKPMQMNGRQVRAFTAPLKNDPQGAGGARYRQRIVLIAMLQHTATYRKLVNRPFISKIAGQAVTNAHFSEILAISDNYRGASQHVINNSLERGDQQDRQRVGDIANDNLHLPKRSLLPTH